MEEILASSDVSSPMTTACRARVAMIAARARDVDTARSAYPAPVLERREDEPPLSLIDDDLTTDRKQGTFGWCMSPTPLLRRRDPNGGSRRVIGD